MMGRREGERLKALLARPFPLWQDALSLRKKAAEVTFS